jgi:hypothetical protein
MRQITDAEYGRLRHDQAALRRLAFLTAQYRYAILNCRWLDAQELGTKIDAELSRIEKGTLIDAKG